MRFTIDLVSEFGEPLEPKEAASVFVYQCGAIVRDVIPITTHKWNKPGKKSDRVGETFFDDRAKEDLGIHSWHTSLCLNWTLVNSMRHYG